MKALYAFVFVCMSFHAFAVPAETPDNYLTYFKDVDDLDFVDETAAHDATPFPAIAMAPATEADSLVANEDCAENFNAVETVPAVVAAIEPRDEDPIPQSATRGPDTAMAPATEADTLIADKDGAENLNAVGTVPGIAAVEPRDEGPIVQSTTGGPDIATAPATEADTRIADEAGAGNSNAADGAPGIAAVEPRDEGPIAQSATRLPDVAIAPATEAGAENSNAADAAPGIAAVEPRDEGPIVQSTTGGPDIATAPATEADTQVADEAGAEKSNAADTVPGIATIEPRDEGAIVQSTTGGPDIATAPATEADTPIADEAGAEKSNATDTVPGIAATQPSDEEVTKSFAEVRDDR